MSKRFWVGLVVLAVFGVTGLCGDWSQWRGPEFNGSTDEKGLVSSWSATENIKWKLPLPGAGSSTPIVCGGRVFISSADAEDNKAALAICVDAKSGEELWSKKFVTSGRKLPRNNAASPSPVTDGKHVWFLFGNGDLACFDYAGNRKWHRNIETEYGNISIKYGYSSSPLLYAGKLFVVVLRRPTVYRDPQSEKPLESFILAIDPKTGKDIYRHIRIVDALDESFDIYGSAIPFEHKGRKEVLILGGDHVTSHDPGTGTELWRYECSSEKRGNWRQVSSLTVGKGMIYGVQARGKGLFAVKPGGKGKVGAEQVAWTFDGPTPDSTTPLYYKGNVYVLQGSKKKTITCLDAKTGVQKWQDNLPGKSTYYASLTASEGKIYCINDSGQAVVFAAFTEGLNVLSTFDFAEGPVRASIAIADSRLFVRTAKNLYCIGK